MPKEWRVSSGVEAFLEQVLTEIPPIPFTFYPCIGWTLGGTSGKRGGPQTPLPPEYSLGFIEQRNLVKYRAVASRAFGFIAFSPKPEDERSSRRLIDFDGKNIVVR